MSAVSRVRAAAMRNITRLIPARRRDWVEAVWAEAPEVSPGLRRLVWRAGGVRLIAHDLLMRRRNMAAILFAAAAGSVVWEVWPGSTTSFSTGFNRVDALAMVAMLAGLAIASRLLLGPSSNSRVAKFLRVGMYVGFLALIPARAATTVFAFEQPRGGVALLLYRAIEHKQESGAWLSEILSLVIFGLCAAAMLWITSRRSRVVPSTLFVGATAGLALGVVMYLVAPLGLSKEATNPWLPGSDIDPLVFLAWMLVLFGPCVAGGVAYQRHKTSNETQPPKGDLARQAVTAALLANLVGALFVTILGTGTVALTINASWLRDWLYHGRHLLFGVAGLQPVLRGDPGAISYSHEITAVSDAGVFIVLCIVFLVIAIVATGFVAMCVLIDSPAEPGNPRRNEGSPPEPEQPPEPPSGAQIPHNDDEVGFAINFLGRHDRANDIEQDGHVVGTTSDGVLQPVGAR
jgi:hypothetical protein